MSKTDINPPRSSSLPGTRVHVGVLWNAGNNSFSIPYSSTWPMTARLDTITRRSLTSPSYQHLSETGGLPENAFFFKKAQTVYPAGVLKFEKVRNSREVATGVFSITMPNLTTISSIRRFNLANQVKQKLSQKIMDSNVNLAVAYAEREQTFRMLADALTRLRHAYSAAKSGRYGDALSALGVSVHSRNGSLRNRGNIARGVLEVQYGWRPLLSDIYGLCEAIAKQNRRQQYVMCTTRSTIEETSSWTVINGEFRDDFEVKAKLTISARIKMRSAHPNLMEAKEIGLTNPALVAWEKVPFSFVVDWAIPIGSFLGQFDASLGWEFVNGSITYVDDCTGSLDRASANPPGYVYHHAAIRGENSEFTVDRVGIGSFGALLSLPYVKNPASFEHCLNALALLNSKR